MNNALTTPFVQGSPEWLEARLDRITSADAPIIAGERGSILALWAEKTRQVEPEPIDPDTARLFEWGHRLEPVIADWYSDTTGRPLRRVNRMIDHPQVPYASASLDRVSGAKGERRVVEIKATRWGTGWTLGEPLPGAVKAQVQHQLWVVGYPVADVVVLKGGSEPLIIEEPRDDTYIADLAFLEADFHQHVETLTPPKADGSENARRAIARMHPADDGTILPATADLRDMAEQLGAARAAKKEAEDLEATIANALRLIIGDASGVDGILTLRKSADSLRVSWPQVAAAYREVLTELLHDASMGTDLWPATAKAAIENIEAVQSLFSKTVPGPRVLRLLKESNRE